MANPKAESQDLADVLLRQLNVSLPLDELTSPVCFSSKTHVLRNLVSPHRVARMTLITVFRSRVQPASPCLYSSRLDYPKGGHFLAPRCAY